MVSTNQLSNLYFLNIRESGLRHVFTQCCCAMGRGIIITILDIINRPVFYLGTQRFGDWVMSPPSRGTYSVGPRIVSRRQASSMHLTQLSRFYLKKETESSLRNVLF
jgi:hypothetical protein